MADRIHQPLADQIQLEIEIGNQDSLPEGQRRDHMSSLRIDNCCHTAATDGACCAIIAGDPRDLFVREPARGVDNEATALKRMIAELDLRLVGKCLAEE